MIDSIKPLFLLCYFFLASCLVGKGQKKDEKLQKKVSGLLTGFKGETGVYIKHLGTGEEVEIRADSIFPTASMVKIPILLGIMDKISSRELDYHQELLYRDSLLYPGEDILGSFKDSQVVQLSKVLMLMLTTSDNTASLWLQSLAGTGTRINELLERSGYQQTRVNSRTPGREAARNLFGWGQTTPREMARMMEQMYKGSLLNPVSSEAMLRLLGRNYWDEEGLSQIPPYIFAASKNGAVNRSRSETVLVMAPHGPYVYSIITKNQADESWGRDNEGFVLLRRLSSLLWKHFEPGSSWRPSIGADGKPAKN
jgi:beta-lactamase class A